jgi:Tol biopolymer transport system component
MRFGSALLGVALSAVIVIVVIAAVRAGVTSSGRGEQVRPVEPASPVGDSAPEPATGSTATDLVLVDPVTGDTSPVVDLEGHQLDGERSPDGTKVAYQGGRLADGPQIHVLDADGTDRQLTDLRGGAGAPTWSPDGRRIAFVSPLKGGDADIYVMRADGSGLRRLVGTGRDDLAPDWSPDGTRLAFQSGEWTAEPGSTIWVASLEDGNRRRTTFRGDGDGYPRWSPDGRWIAFLRYDDGPSGNLEIDDSDFWLMRSDGSRQRRLVAEEGPLPHLTFRQMRDRPGTWGMTSADDHFQDAPTWSPDGTAIAFTGGHCGCITLVEVATGKLLDDIGGDFHDASWDREGILVSASARELQDGAAS